MAKPPHIEVRKVLSRIKSVRDVHVARSAKVTHECRWAPGHVGAEYGGGLTQPYCPPCAAVARDVRLVCVHPLRPA